MRRAIHRTGTFVEKSRTASAPPDGKIDSKPKGRKRKGRKYRTAFRDAQWQIVVRKRR
jgi:hypothetical protein